MKKILLVAVASLMLAGANYATNAGKTAADEVASTACYYVITVTDSNGCTVDGMRYLKSDYAVPCVNRANADAASFREMYPAKSGYTVTLTWPELWSGPKVQ